jgi:rhodanese-related sulfurtransferase
LILTAAQALFLACSAQAPQAEQSAHSPSEAAPEAVVLDVNQLKQRLDAGEDVYLLDVRRPDELAEHGAIQGAVNIPIDELEANLDKVPRDRPVAIYCQRGGRASRAAELLRERGYTEPLEYGGILEWKEKGYPVVYPGGESSPAQ